VIVNKAKHTAQNIVDTLRPNSLRGLAEEWRSLAEERELPKFLRVDSDIVRVDAHTFDALFDAAREAARGPKKDFDPEARVEVRLVEMRFIVLHLSEQKPDGPVDAVLAAWAEQAQQYGMPDGAEPAEAVFRVLVHPHTLKVLRGRALLVHDKKVRTGVEETFGKEAAYRATLRAGFSNSQPVDLEPAEEVMARKLLSDIGKTFHLRYRREDAVELERYVTPQAMGLYKGHFYLFVWCELRDDMRAMRLDRIQHIDPIEDADHKPRVLSPPELAFFMLKQPPYAHIALVAAHLYFGRS
jgi:hypothetical protein